MTTYHTYRIWRRLLNDRIVTKWIQTAHSVKARSDDEAQSKVRRRFAGAGFHSMSLVAVLEGVDPNVPVAV